MNENKEEIMRINYPVRDPIYDDEKYEEYEILDYQVNSLQLNANLMIDGL